MDSICWCFHMGSEQPFFVGIQQFKNISCETKHLCFKSCSFWAIDGIFPGDFDCRTKMSVRVQKGGFMIKTLRHHICCLNVVFETLELHLLSVLSSTGGPWRPLETTGDHRSQFPRTDLGWFCKSSPLPTPPGPLKLRSWAKSSWGHKNIKKFTLFLF